MRLLDDALKKSPIRLDRRCADQRLAGLVDDSGNASPVIAEDRFANLWNRPPHSARPNWNRLCAPSSPQLWPSGCECASTVRSPGPAFRSLRVSPGGDPRLDLARERPGDVADRARRRHSYWRQFGYLRARRLFDRHRLVDAKL